MNHGGVAITNYLIFVNMSQQVVSTDTTTTLTLNSTGQHLIETSAVNKCGLVGDHVSIIITTGNDKIESILLYQIIIISLLLDFNVLVTTTSDGSSTSGIILLYAGLSCVYYYVSADTRVVSTSAMSTTSTNTCAGKNNIVLWCLL